MAKKDTGDTDWMKYFCVIFGALLVVVGFFYFKTASERKEYAAANVLARKLVTGEGLVREDSSGNPTTIPDLAIQVHQYTSAYKEAMAGSKGGIPQTEMTAAATNANMSQIHAGGVRSDQFRAKNFQQVSRDFTYAACTLEQLATLMYNVERKGRLKVFEVRWQLEEDKTNNEAPFHKIRKPLIKVGLREPLATN